MVDYSLTVLLNSLPGLFIGSLLAWTIARFYHIRARDDLRANSLLYEMYLATLKQAFIRQSMEQQKEEHPYGFHGIPEEDQEVCKHFEEAEDVKRGYR